MKGKLKMNVNIDEEDFLEILMNQLKQWTDDETALSLFREKYERDIGDGIFESNQMTVAQIVNNDWLNWCEVIYKKDNKRLYNRLIKLVENGQWDVSGEDWSKYDYSPCLIEAYNDDAVLIRI